MSRLPPDELEDKLFLAMLDLSRKGAGPEFELLTVCRDCGIEGEPQQLISFTSDNDGLRGNRDITNKQIRFTWNAEGKRHALLLEDKYRPVTVTDRVKSITRSDWIALGAFIVSIFALFRD